MKTKHVLDEDFDSLYRIGLVIDDDDPDQLSCVQVRIFPELKDVEEAKLPWAKPKTKSLGQGTTHGKHAPPEIGSFVQIEVKQNWNSFFYDCDASIDGLAQYGNFSTPSEIGTQVYPQPRFTLYKDGSMHFINTETGEQGIVTSTGATIVVDSNGNIKVHSSGNIEIGDTTPQAAARSGDSTVSNIALDAVFWTWLSGAAVILAGLGLAVPTPTSLASQIDSGSAQVTIGD